MFHHIKAQKYEVNFEAPKFYEDFRKQCGVFCQKWTLCKLNG